jgi:hypothetical protein
VDTILVLKTGRMARRSPLTSDCFFCLAEALGVKRVAGRFALCQIPSLSPLVAFRVETVVRVLLPPLVPSVDLPTITHYALAVRRPSEQAMTAPTRRAPVTRQLQPTRRPEVKTNDGGERFLVLGHLVFLALSEERGGDP